MGNWFGIIASEKDGRVLLVIGGVVFIVRDLPEISLDKGERGS
jgi:hypothetical protein